MGELVRSQQHCQSIACLSFSHNLNTKELEESNEKEQKK
jgi:hypothetical protein